MDADDDDVFLTRLELFGGFDEKTLIPALRTYSVGAGRFPVYPDPGLLVYGAEGEVKSFAGPQIRQIDGNAIPGRADVRLPQRLSPKLTDLGAAPVSRIHVGRVPIFLVAKFPGSSRSSHCTGNVRIGSYLSHRSMKGASSLLGMAWVMS